MLPRRNRTKLGWLMAQNLLPVLRPNLHLFEERSKRPWSFVLLFCSGPCLLSGALALWENFSETISHGKPQTGH